MASMPFDTLKLADAGFPPRRRSPKRWVVNWRRRFTRPQRRRSPRRKGTHGRQVQAKAEIAALWRAELDAKLELLRQGHDHSARQHANSNRRRYDRGRDAHLHAASLIRLGGLKQGLAATHTLI
jgi:hypothetical protein